MIYLVTAFVLALSVGLYARQRVTVGAAMLGLTLVLTVAVTAPVPQQTTLVVVP